MGLSVYKGNEASRLFENTFFRSFAATLNALFDRQGFDGVLIGFSEVPENGDLYPDCVLITNNRILIIDFKKWDKVDIYLPSADEFESKAWTTSTGGKVKAGSDYNINPLVQLRKQESRLEKILGYRPNEDVMGIGCMVVFQGDVNIKGDIPGKYSGWFAIADKYNYGNAIYDMIDVRSKSKNDPEALRKKYFKASEYIK